MKIAVIADDLTGANDTGVQFARNGLKTSVLIQPNGQILPDLDVVVMDTDSRSVSGNEAYLRVKAASEYLSKYHFNLVYKKIDSTLRGNIGSELDAVYHVYAPDFIIIAPAYPNNKRVVRNGHLFVKERAIHQTEFANDPKTPIHTSYVPDILRKGSNHEVGIITKENLVRGKTHVLNLLNEMKEQNIPYILFDSDQQSDLDEIVTYINQSRFKVVWSGSAGLAHALKMNYHPLKQNEKLHIQYKDATILTVIGSVNKRTREQLDVLRADESNKCIRLQSHLIVGNDLDCGAEVKRVIEETRLATKDYKSVVIYSAGDKAEIEEAVRKGVELQLTPTMVSDRISQVLGQITNEIMEKQEVYGLVLTGGDTARQVCVSLGVSELNLVDDIEEGIPVGFLHWKNRDILTITKAGGFGSRMVLKDAINYLKGGEVSCAQSLE
ncbi:four-carbon acid sugar kinase family protein [Gracilibacillus salitolerans]|uniref:Four-carbon acid sugar kinase family protein n=1 Tax=Gracilibacillus salitolerans TaxID=2663022 RepID=A0A5Q2THR0_9BACI|nr:four-carbon acid sugar kinase family protein [Gracilibacillus salitolerans]QGH33503.1 four-carbon acid sugar kinase family protein [Gracilibacillus salitolerans]